MYAYIHHYNARVHLLARYIIQYRMAWLAPDTVNAKHNIHRLKIGRITLTPLEGIGNLVYEIPR
jgi:hypothetical protein